MLGRVGIEVEVRPTELAILLAGLDRGHYDLTLLEMPELFEPHVLSWFFASNKIPNKPETFGANRAINRVPRDARFGGLIQPTRHPR